jgi:hypothetical protein
LCSPIYLQSSLKSRAKGGYFSKKKRMLPRILIGLVLLSASILYVRGLSMDEICEKHKAHGRCDNGNIAKQCSKQCGGGSDNSGGGDKPTPAPSKPSPGPTPAKNQKSNNNAQPKPTTQAPSNNNGGGGAKKIGNCDKRSPCISMEDANRNFRTRCEAIPDAQLKTGCHDHCKYDEDTNTIKNAFLKGPCKLNELRTYLTAASNSKDNSGCCQDTGVLSQKKTGVCGCFCNPTGPVWPGKGEAVKYAPCVSVLTGIMQCHYYAEGA